MREPAALLFAVLGSNVVDVAVAVSPMISRKPRFPACTVTLTVTESPGASEPVVQVTVPRVPNGGAVHDVPDGALTDWKVAKPLKVSLRTTFWAESGPLFFTVIVNVTGPPSMRPLVGLTVVARSADASAALAGMAGVARTAIAAKAGIHAIALRRRRPEMRRRLQAA